MMKVFHPLNLENEIFKKHVKFQNSVEEEIFLALKRWSVLIYFEETGFKIFLLSIGEEG